MEIERSQYTKGEKAFVFDKWEKELIAIKLKPEIKKRRAQIERIKNHSKNEGQTTYLEQIRIIKQEINTIDAIIEGMMYSQKQS